MHKSSEGSRIDWRRKSDSTQEEKEEKDQEENQEGPLKEKVGKKKALWEGKTGTRTDQEFRSTQAQAPAQADTSTSTSTSNATDTRQAKRGRPPKLENNS